MKDVKYFIFRQNIRHYTKNRYILYILNFLELIMIYVPLMNICFSLSSYKKNRKKPKNHFLIFSPYYYIHLLYSKSDIFSYFFVGLVTILFILYRILFTFKIDFKNKIFNILHFKDIF